MNHFQYRDGELYAEDVPLARIAEVVGTPFYCYSTATLVRHYRVFADAFNMEQPLICFSVKANSNLAVLRTLADLGAGADVVSEGELRRAIAAGVPPKRIIFSGVGKTRDELAFALEQGILQINVESMAELEVLSEIAAARGAVMDVAIRINPDVDASTHDKIATGRRADKFGIAIADAPAAYAYAAALPGVRPVSVAVHIGSQLTDLDPFRRAFSRIAELVLRLRADGYDIHRLDLGGGLGVPYKDEAPPLPADYAATVRETVGGLDCELVFEPGRVIAGNAGVLITRVVYLKGDEDQCLVIVDAAMNDLMRPTLYGAYHEILPVHEAGPDAARRPMDVVGPVCESGDTFARGRLLPTLVTGDLLAFATAGAYGAVMASSYNTRPLVPEVLVSGKKFAVVRRRPNYDEIIGLDTLADWQVAEEKRYRSTG